MVSAPKNPFRKYKLHLNPPWRPSEASFLRFFLVLGAEHPHGTCTQVKHVYLVHWLAGSGQFSVQFTKEVEWNMRQWSKRHKTSTFSSNPHIPHFDMKIRMVYSPKRNVSTLSTGWLKVVHSRCSLLRMLNGMCGSGQNVTKRTLFHQIHTSCTLTCKSAWYMHSSETCRHCLLASWKWSILGAFS